MIFSDLVSIPLAQLIMLSMQKIFFCPDFCFLGHIPLAVFPLSQFCPVLSSKLPFLPQLYFPLLLMKFCSVLSSALHHFPFSFFHFCTLCTHFMISPTVHENSLVFHRLHTLLSHTFYTCAPVSATWLTRFTQSLSF